MEHLNDVYNRINVYNHSIVVNVHFSVWYLSSTVIQPLIGGNKYSNTVDWLWLDHSLIVQGVYLCKLKHVLESGLANQNHDSFDTITDLQN